MNLCIYNVTSTYIPGGLETYCWEMGRALARRGHRVTLMAGNQGDAWHNEVRLLQYAFRPEKTWLDLGHRFQRLMERLSFARHALTPLINEQFDAVVICKPYDFIPMWWAKRCGLKSKIMFHTNGTDFYFGDRWFSGVADAWAACSRYTANQQEAHYGIPTGVVHNGVDADLFRPMERAPHRRAELGVPEDARLILSVGRFVGWKGLRLIIDALPALPDDVHYLAVGAGPEEQRMREQITALGLTQRVHFAGRLPHDTLPEVMSLADLYVQPSIGEESFGIGALEAMACGLPVLVSRKGGLLEVLGDEGAGAYVAAGDGAAWQFALQTALADLTKLKQMGMRARARAERELTWAACAARLETYLMGMH